MRHAAVLVLFFGLMGCGDDDRPPSDAGPRPDGSPPVDAAVDAPRERAPVFRNPVDLDNRALAFEALRILGAPEAGATVGYCNDCHGLTRETIESWSALTNDAMSTCLTDLLVTTDEAAAAMVACSRDGTGRYAASQLGIVSTAADLEWFRYVFRHGSGDVGTWPAEHARFVEQAGMPRDGYVPLTQEQFDVVMEWFRRNIPEIGAVLGGGPKPGDCVPLVGPEVAAHVTAMSTTGWRVRNVETSLLMYGCAGAATARDCLAAETLAVDTTFGATWDVVPESFLRVLYSTTYSSSYWTRSSADGRFVGHGGGSAGGSTIVDLERDVAIPADASYDPAFFPDNSGFVFHGGGAMFCEQSVLMTGTPSRITFREPGCAAVSGVGLYEHIGTSLDGGDYWAVSGEFVSDDGGHGVTRGDPAATFSPGSTLTLTAMVNTGTGFVSAATTGLPIEYEGDTVISPSSRLLVSRLSGMDGRQNGFTLRRLDAMRAGATITATTPLIGRYCLNGGKPAFSYDERWMVVHHYVEDTDADAMELGFTGVADPGWGAYRSSGASNIFLVDLLDGTRTRITHMAPGQYALFPHFRSDGWIYFIVRQGGAPGEHIVASDVALMME